MVSKFVDLLKTNPKAESVKVDEDKKIVYLLVTDNDVVFAAKVPHEIHGYKVVGCLSPQAPKRVQTDEQTRQLAETRTFIEKIHNMDDFWKYLIPNCAGMSESFKTVRGFTDYSRPCIRYDLIVEKSDTVPLEHQPPKTITFEGVSVETDVETWQIRSCSKCKMCDERYAV